MRAVEIARKFAALGQKKDALSAYVVSLQNGGMEPSARLEAAVYILQNGGDYRISYTVFRQLYNEGFCQDDILRLMEKVFYEPNISLMKGRYERNCKRLAKYPYLFRKDFLPFDELPIRFFPYDEHNGYVPFDMRTRRFGGFVNVRDTRITRNFFKDLEDPILAKDVFSQYELEYLNDNVRKSEWVGRENHIYLHYTDWSEFCAWLQVLNMKPLTESGKVVFLIEDEIGQYPIDFKERFGIDYSQYPLQPVHIREVSRLIWHTQLSTHNGGDFFNEIFDAHPNLLAMPSIMFSNYEENIGKLRELVRKEPMKRAVNILSGWPSRLVADMYQLHDLSDKDLLVAMYMGEESWNRYVDPASRIAPAIFYQPHFPNIVYRLRASQSGDTVLEAKNVEEIHRSQMVKGFKYIKTFTPMRRFTTSHGATVRFMYDRAQEKNEDADSKEKGVVSDAISERVFNRSFMIDPEDRLYHDGILVRFEDGKLNPKATFTVLAAFLDLPYTESMTRCTERGGDYYSTGEKIIGFSTGPVYKTYDDYVNDSERYFIEYFLRDAYEYYGYSFHYYDGKPVDEEKVAELIRGFTTINHYMRDTWKWAFQVSATATNGESIPEAENAVREKLADNYINRFAQNRFENAKVLLEGLRFVNKNGQPLYMMPMLKPDPALLENPIYH